MENQDERGSGYDLDNFFHLSFDSIGRAQLKKIALWAKICSISSLVGYALQLYLWLFGHSQALIVPFGGVFGALLGVTVIGGGGLFNYLLFRFAAAVGRGLESMDAYPINGGLRSLKMYFRTFSIVVIVAFCIFLLAVISYLISAAASRY